MQSAVLTSDGIDLEIDVAIDLKPCPFCGSHARRSGGRDDPWYFVQCSKEECGVIVSSASKWNRRDA